MLALQAVDFAYGDRAILRAIDLAIAPGTLVCVIGANGAGKSTLLRIMGGLLAPTTGRVTCFGSDPRRGRRRALARRLAYVPQDYQLAFPFTVRDVVLMGRYAHGRRGLFGFASGGDGQRADDAMARTDVGHLADRRWSTLSGGEQRRALLAQAFCQQAELVLLDEPTASLDPAHAIALFAALAAERERGTTAVVVTHELNLAVRFADRVLLLDRGALAADGPAREVIASEATARAFEVPMHVGALDDGTPYAVPGR